MTTLVENHQPKTLPSGFEIESWDDVVGNYEFTVLCKDLVERVRNEGSREAFRMLVTGVSRGGKTSLIEYLIKTLLCCNLDRTSLVPCGQCVNCSDRVYKHGTGDWVNHIAFFDESENSTPVRFHYHPLDCSRAGASEIENLLNEVNWDDGDLRIIYLDEVHRLSRQSLDERFLKTARIVQSNLDRIVGYGEGVSQRRLSKAGQNVSEPVSVSNPD